MSKKILVIIISVFLISPALVPVFSIFTANETRVCGVDNNNYPNIAQAEKLGVEVSYDFPCQSPESETGLFERSEEFGFTGMLLDFFAGDNNSLQLYVKDNFDGSNYFVVGKKLNNTDPKQYLPGDQLNILGKINKNTKIITANSLRNLSLEKDTLQTRNCEIVPTYKSSNVLACLDDEEEFLFSYDDQTHFVSGFVNPAKASDLVFGDEVKVRFNEDYKIELLVVLKRNNLKFVKNHIFETKAKFVSLDIDNNFINLQLERYPEAISDIDGIERTLDIKMETNKDTRVVKKYFGKLSAEDFKPGDELYIVASAKDYGDFEAKLIKNNSVWK